MLKQIKYILMLVVILILLVIGYNLFSSNKKDSSQGKMIVSLESSLEKIENSSNLESLQYTYNSIVEVPSASDPDKLLYHVMYEGTVTMGIDLSKIEVEPNPESENSILVKLPPIEFQTTYVEPGSLDYLYTGEAKEEETSGIDAYKTCQEDLKKAVKKDKKLKKIARQNVEDELDALFDSIKASEDQDLEVDYQWSE